VENAVRHGLDAGREAITVSIVAADEGATALLTVEDDGPGFSAGVEDRAFDRFASARDAQTADPRGRHYGLGLALVAEVVSRHHGAVDASNRPEGGAVVTVRLPKRQ